MKKFVFIFFIFICFSAFSQTPLIQNAINRQSLSLNGKWNHIIDLYETGYYDYRLLPFDEGKNYDKAFGGFYTDAKPADKSDRIEYSFDFSPCLMVPGDWNTQDDKLFYYEGSIWYRKQFKYKKAAKNNRVFVYFGAANYETDVYLNRIKLGKHIGGFTPFNFEITQLLVDTTNTLIVKVDNKRKREGVPTVNTDWTNYGGLTRDVFLVEVPEVFIEDYFIQLKKGDAKTIAGYVQLNGAKSATDVIIDIPEAKIKHKITTNEYGFAQFEFPVKNLNYWSPVNPKLYNVIISTNQEKIIDRIGFRLLETKGTEILVNGKPVFLRGICIHEENPLRANRAYSKEDAVTTLNWVKELNCNFVRLAHYPHNEHIIRLADEMGIMVWEEDPVYWTIEWSNPNTLANAKNQLTEVIKRDHNRASVIIWSMANETPKSDARLTFLKELASTARSLDNTRFISAAMEKEQKTSDPLTQVVHDDFAEVADIVSFNQYVGWYDGLPEKCNRVKWEIPYNKPVIISEFGGCALAGYHGDSLTRWTEEFQEDLYIQTIKMIKQIPQLRGLTPWILTDFRSPKRLLPNIHDGFNRKGLISNSGDKKKAFWILKKYYDEVELIFK